MSATDNPKKTSLPSLRMNKFIVNQRASMFETAVETPREKRERSPCGILETSERKMEARKEKERKKEMVARRKRQADPYAEESSEPEERHPEIECRICPHANNSVNLSLVKKTLKAAARIGSCTQCRKNQNELDPGTTEYDPVIWLCLFCGQQGCDRNTNHQHALQHYRTPRSDPHCLILSTQAWTVWCYVCDCEVVQSSTKKLDEAVKFIKRLSDMANKRPAPSRTSSRATTPSLMSSGSISSTKSSIISLDGDNNSKTSKTHRNSQVDLNVLPKVKGLSNLGNTCFFNSVLQNLAQTHMLNQLFDVQLQSGQKISLPGRPKSTINDDKKKIDRFIDRNNHDSYKDRDGEEDEDNEDDVDLKPLDLLLGEGGGLSIAFSAFLKEMHAMGKNGHLNPGHLFGQICKRSTQFIGYEQQDAHELLRCLLDAIRNEEIIRTKRSILKAFALSEKSDPNTVSPKLRKMIKGYGQQATHTIVDQIFGGHMLSTVFCEECHCSSQVFEPFMDLSLPINEEKGPPRKQSPPDKEYTFDCFGRSGYSSSKNLSKHQQKKQKKEDKKKKGQGRGRGKATLTPSCIKPNPEDENDMVQRRLTEKRRPGDIEEMKAREEEIRRQKEAGEAGKTKAKGGESSKFRSLVKARNESRRNDDQGEEDGGSNDRDVESDEELEYDTEEHEEEDDISLGGGRRRSLHGASGGSTNSLNRIGAKTSRTMEQEKITETEEEDDEEDDEEEEDEDEEEEEEEEEEETEETDDDSDGSSKKKDSSLAEISDADVEDNTDSEWLTNSHFRNTRHPSIVVNVTEDDKSHSEENLNHNHRNQSSLSLGNEKALKQTENKNVRWKHLKLFQMLCHGAFMAVKGSISPKSKLAISMYQLKNIDLLLERYASSFPHFDFYQPMQNLTPLIIEDCTGSQTTLGCYMPMFDEAPRVIKIEYDEELMSLMSPPPTPSKTAGKPKFILSTTPSKSLAKNPFFNAQDKDKEKDPVTPTKRGPSSLSTMGRLAFGGNKFLSQDLSKPPSPLPFIGKSKKSEKAASIEEEKPSDFTTSFGENKAINDKEAESVKTIVSNSVTSTSTSVVTTTVATRPTTLSLPNIKLPTISVLAPENLNDTVKVSASSAELLGQSSSYLPKTTDATYKPTGSLPTTTTVLTKPPMSIPSSTSNIRAPPVIPTTTTTTKPSILDPKPEKIDIPTKSTTSSIKTTTAPSLSVSNSMKPALPVTKPVDVVVKPPIATPIQKKPVVKSASAPQSDIKESPKQYTEPVASNKTSAMTQTTSLPISIPVSKIAIVPGTSAEPITQQNKVIHKPDVSISPHDKIICTTTAEINLKSDTKTYDVIAQPTADIKVDDSNKTKDKPSAEKLNNLKLTKTKSKKLEEIAPVEHTSKPSWTKLDYFSKVEVPMKQHSSKDDVSKTDTPVKPDWTKPGYLKRPSKVEKVEKTEPTKDDILKNPDAIVKPSSIKAKRQLLRPQKSLDLPSADLEISNQPLASSTSVDDINVPFLLDVEPNEASRSFKDSQSKVLKTSEGSTSPKDIQSNLPRSSKGPSSSKDSKSKISNQSADLTSSKDVQSNASNPGGVPTSDKDTKGYFSKSSETKQLQEPVKISHLEIPKSEVKHLGGTAKISNTEPQTNLQAPVIAKPFKQKPPPLKLDPEPIPETSTIDFTQNVGENTTNVNNGKKNKSKYNQPVSPTAKQAPHSKLKSQIMPDVSETSKSTVGESEDLEKDNHAKPDDPKVTKIQKSSSFKDKINRSFRKISTSAENVTKNKNEPIDSSTNVQEPEPTSPVSKSINRPEQKDESTANTSQIKKKNSFSRIKTQKVKENINAMIDTTASTTKKIQTVARKLSFASRDKDKSNINRPTSPKLSQSPKDEAEALETIQKGRPTSPLNFRSPSRSKQEEDVEGASSKKKTNRKSFSEVCTQNLVVPINQLKNTCTDKFKDFPSASSSSNKNTTEHSARSKRRRSRGKKNSLCGDAPTIVDTSPGPKSPIDSPEAKSPIDSPEPKNLLQFQFEIPGQFINPNEMEGFVQPKPRQRQRRRKSRIQNPMNDPNYIFTDFHQCGTEEEKQAVLRLIEQSKGIQAVAIVEKVGPARDKSNIGSKCDDGIHCGTDEEQEAQKKSSKCDDGIHCGTDEEQEVQKKSSKCDDGIHCGTDEEQEAQKKSSKCDDGIHCGTDEEQEVQKKSSKCDDGIHCGTDEEQEAQKKSISKCDDGIHCGTDEEQEAQKKSSKCDDGIHCGTDEDQEAQKKTSKCDDGIHCGTDEEQRTNKKSSKCSDGIHCGTDDEKPKKGKKTKKKGDKSEKSKTRKSKTFKTREPIPKYKRCEENFVGLLDDPCVHNSPILGNRSISSSLFSINRKYGIYDGKDKPKNLLSKEGLTKSHSDSRYLSTSNSADHLNYYTSASENSDRYFTASDAGKYCNGAETGDDEDKKWDRSGRKSNYSWDTFDTNKKMSVNQDHFDELSHKMSDLKIRRKSSSKESLLDTHLRLNHKRGSTETLHTFNTDKIIENDELYKRKTHNIKKLRQEWIARSLTTIAPRYQCRTQECSVMSCLTSFTAPELLTGGNKITCENCTKLYKQMHPDDDSVTSIKSNASKQMLILSPPAVLTLQLKRFHHVGYNLSKVNRFVQFPLVLDLAPFTSSISGCLGNMSKNQTQVLYGLYGVVEHSGRLNAGHYVAYVRSRPMDPARTNRQMLNQKPSCSFEINQLVREMAEKLESEGGNLRHETKSSQKTAPQVKVEDYEEEIKSGRWFHVSDSYVSEITIERVLKSQAYLLFYERLI